MRRLFLDTVCFFLVVGVFVIVTLLMTSCSSTGVRDAYSSPYKGCWDGDVVKEATYGCLEDADSGFLYPEQAQLYTDKPPEEYALDLPPPMPPEPVPSWKDQPSEEVLNEAVEIAPAVKTKKTVAKLPTKVTLSPPQKKAKGKPKAPPGGLAGRVSPKKKKAPPPCACKVRKAVR